MLEQMRSEGIEPNVITYSAAISACEKGKKWEKALSLLEQMRDARIKPDVISYSAAISACEKGGQWERALSLLEQMRGEGIEPDVISYSAAISACEKGSQWEKALSLLEQMRDEGIKPNVISYNAAISACEKGGQWKKALLLFKQMRELGVQPDVISYNAVIQACASAGQPIVALKTFDEAQQNGEVNCITYNAILDAVCTSNPAKARELYRRGFSLYGSVESTENGVPMLDLHEHSEGAGETAVRWWLEERVPAMISEPEQLTIVTGWGKSRSALQDSDLRGRVERVLAELGVSTLPVDNKGRFLVNAQVWQRQQALRDNPSSPLQQPPLQD